jgi:hypothetical protein
MTTEPFAHLATPIIRKKVFKQIRPASPEKKIAEVEELSVRAGLPDVGKALRGIYDPIIRRGRKVQCQEIAVPVPAVSSECRRTRKRRHF